MKKGNLFSSSESKTVNAPSIKSNLPKIKHIKKSIVPEKEKLK
jgi:hypothetical protein